MWSNAALGLFVGLRYVGEPLIEALLGGGVEILRPHYQTTRLWPPLVDGLLARFGKRPGFHYPPLDRLADAPRYAAALLQDTRGFRERSAA